MTVVMIATPAYPGLTAGYVASIQETRFALRDRGVKAAWQSIEMSLLSHARNELASAFWRSDMDVLAMIDGDIRWKAETFLKLLERTKKSPFVAAAPPLRRFDHDRMIEAAKRRIENPKPLANVFGAETPSDGALQVDDEGFTTIPMIGTAFIMMTREVIVKLAAAHPELHYNSVNGKGCALFNPFIVNGEPLAEDWAFAHRWTSSGGKIDLLVDAPLEHQGPVAVAGNFAEYVSAKERFRFITSLDAAPAAIFQR